MEEKTINPTILLVDDNADMLEHISSLLVENFSVITATNGMEALRKMKEITPELVLTNIFMPVMDGLELLKEIKSNEPTANIPVILLTSSTVEDSRIEIWQSGADDYLVKPFSRKELITRINQQIKIQKLRAADVTEQIKARNQIEERESFSRTALESNPDCVKVIDTEGRLTYMNFNGLRLMEIDDFTYVKNNPWLNLWDEKNKPIVKDAIEKSFAGKTSKFQAMRPTAKGNSKWWDVIVSPIVSPDGKISQIISVSRDITLQIEARKNIEESEQRLRLATQSSGVGIWEWNVITNKIRWDAQMFHIYGITPTADGIIDYETWRNCLASEDLDEQESKLQETVKNGGNGQRAFRIFKTSNNMPRDIEAVETVRMNSEGETEWVIGTNMDVTERNSALKKIKENEKKFQAAINAVEGIIWTNNASGQMEGEQPAWANLTGQTYEEYQGCGWTKAVHPDDVLPTLNAWAKAVTNKSTFKFEHRVKTERDGYKLFSIKAIPILDEDCTIQQWVGVHTDITEQRAATQKIQESEERFRSLAQTLPQLIWVTDAKGNPEFASFRWKEFSGIEPAGENEWKAIVHPDDYDAVNAAWINSLNTGTNYKHNVRLKNKNGQYIWHAGIGVAVLDESKKIVKWIGAFTNVHDQKNIEQRLEEQVWERTAELRHKNTDLLNLNKQLETFAFISSHDLQEPLRKIQIFTNLILDTYSVHMSKKGKFYLKKVDDEATRMRQLIEDLLSFSLLTSSENKFETIDPAEIIEELKEEFKEIIKAKNAVIITSKLCEIKVIPFQFRQLIHNLLSNSIKYSKPDTRLRITIKSEYVKGKEVDSELLLPENLYCHISFADNGIGFEQQFSEKIFEVFQRLHGKEEFEGTGIGLAIVKRIVDNHNGFITAVGHLGKGATFNIYIPL